MHGVQGLNYMLLQLVFRFSQVHLIVLKCAFK